MTGIISIAIKAIVANSLVVLLEKFAHLGTYATVVWILEEPKMPEVLIKKQ